jgi:O-antigen ligase
MRRFLLFLILFLPFQFALNPSPGIDLSIARVLILLAFFIWFIKGLVLKNITIRNNFISWGLIIFLASVLLSITQAEELNWALRKLLVFGSIFPLYFVASQALRKKDFTQVAKIFTISSSILATLGIFQFISQFFWDKDVIFNFWNKYLGSFFLGSSFSQAVVQHPSWWVNIAGKTYLRATALFPDPHMLGFFLGMSLSLTAYLLLKFPKQKIYLGCFILNCFGLLLTFSRGAYLGFLAAIIFFLIFGSRLLSKQLKQAIILGICFLLIIAFTIPAFRIRLISSFNFNEGSVAGRIEIWQQALSVWQKNFWLGVGIGNYSYWQNPLHSYRLPVYAHNTYLDIAVEMGIIGLLSWLSIFAYSLKKLLEKSSENELLKITLGSSLIYFLIHSFFETPLYSPRILPFLIILLVFVSYNIKEKVSKLN